MLEHRVQPDDLKVRLLEEVEGALRLRGSVRDTSGTQHLKRMQQNRPASQSRQCQWLAGVEPARYRNFGSESHESIPCWMQAKPSQAKPGPACQLNDKPR